MTSTTSRARGGGADAAVASRWPGLALARRSWAVVAVVLAAALWWPAGFWGVDSWLHLPLRALDGDVLLLGATAGAAVVALLVRSPWPRLGIVLGSSGVGWLLSAPASDTYPDEREVLVILLAVAALGGLLVGATGRRGPMAVATVLAAIAGISPADWPNGALLATALALPFVVASWNRVAPTVLSVARILGAWLVFALLEGAVRAGWDILHPLMGTGSKRGTLRLVAEASWEFVRTQWWEHSAQLFSSTVGWFWVAAILALLVAATRGVTSGVRRRSRAASSSRPGG